MAFINPKRMGTYTLTPAGTSIATDDSNVGQQMLRKMGWSPQSGLGKNGNGAVEPVKASCNYGRKGLGKVPTQFSTGMVQQSVFNTILQSLTKHKSSVGPGKKTKLEDKSKQSQSRVHYGKFVRAKDVSQYSQKSLKIILGGPVGRTQNSPEHGIAPSPPENNWPRDASIKQEFGVKTYSSSTDMASYFSLKRRAVKSDTEGLEARKRARLTPPNDEDKEGKPTFADVTLDLSHNAPVDSCSTSPNLEEEGVSNRINDTSYETKSRESDMNELLSEEDQIEATEGHTRQQSTAFSSSNVHSLSGYPFY